MLEDREKFFGSVIVINLEKFKQISNAIIVNWYNIYMDNMKEYK